MRQLALRIARALGFDAGHQVVPRLDEGRGALVLQLGGERIDVDAGLGEAGENRLAVAAVRRERLADLAVLGEGLERALRHGVDREGRGERLHIKGVGGFRVLGAGAGPEQALRAGAGVGGALEARRGEQVADRPCRCAGRSRCRADWSARPGPCRLIATSQRLTKSEATEATAGLSPASMRRSTPRR